VDVTVVAADGTMQTGRVWWNTTTVLHVTAAWDWTPLAGEAYLLGAITADWRTGRICGPDARWDSDVVEMAMHFLMEPGTETALEVWSQGDANPAVDGVVDGTKRVTVLTARSRGKELVLGLQKTSPDTTWEVAAIGLVTQGRENK
jgi:hypothetical protein